MRWMKNHWKIAKRSPDFIALVFEVLILLKDCFKSKLEFLSFVTISVFELYHNCSLNFVTIWIFGFCCYLSCHKLSFGFCHNMRFEFCHNLRFCVLSQYFFFYLCHSLSLSLGKTEFLSFVMTIVFLVFSHFWFRLNLSFWVVIFSALALPQFEFSFPQFEFWSCQNLSFGVLSQF